MTKVLEQIIERSDIVEICSEYLNLKRSGKNYKSLCPFHKEDTPSFFISPDKKLFHCFGCNTGGNVIHFIMRMENIDFLQAVKKLAQRYNISLPTFKNTSDKLERLYKLHEEALNFYRKNLFSEVGKKAMDYLLNERKLNYYIIDKFKLGYSPVNSSLKQYLLEKFSEEELSLSGLFIDTYDRFSGRIIFPLFDEHNKVVGFAGRIISSSGSKYINSSNTPIYNKSKLLYGMNLAKNNIRSKGFAIITEGYMDVISLHLLGFDNAVGSCGTAITQAQVASLKRYTNKIISLYDADTAGKTAIIRSLGLFLENDLEVKVGKLPANTDAAEIAIKTNKETIEKIIEEAEDLLYYRLSSLKEVYDLSSYEGKIAILKDILEILEKMRSYIKQDELIKKVAEELKIDEEIIRLELKRLAKKEIKIKLPSQAPHTENKKDKKFDFLEAIILYLLLTDKKIYDTMINFLEEEDFSEGIKREIFLKIKYDRSLSVNKLLTAPDINEDENILSQLSQLCIEVDKYLEQVQEKEKLYKECISKIMERRAIKLEKKIKEKLNNTAADEHEINALLNDYQELMKQLKKEVIK